MADEQSTPVPVVERVAQIIDPEAFGLPAPDRSNELGGYLTDRDEARARARTAIAARREPTDPMWEKARPHMDSESSNARTN